MVNGFTKRVGGMATLKDVAKHAGVSVAAASYVLSGKKQMSPNVTDRVEQAAKTLGYRLNGAARALRTGQTQMLGLIVPDITNPFFPQLARVIEARARNKSFLTVLFESGYEADTEEQGLNMLTERGVDGLIWVLSGSGRLPSGKPPLPTVIIDYAPPGWSSVRADDYDGGCKQARFAIEAGHKNVALLWGPLSVTSIQERRRGFLDTSIGELNIVLELDTAFNVNLPKTVERKLIDRHQDYTLLVCGNDVLAIGAMKSLKRAGIDVPGDVSVLGFDDTYLSETVEPPLSTMAQPTGKLGTLAVDLLLRSIQDNGAKPETIVVPVSLRERRSTRRLVPRADQSA